MGEIYLSDFIIKDDEKDIRRANFTSKVLWFAICLFAIPIITAIISGFACFNIVPNVYLSFAFGIDIYFFVALLLYKVCDKYRNNPYFDRQDNNLSARINTLFLITIFSLIISSVNDILTLYYTKLPTSNIFALISYFILYLPIFFFYFHKPIDFFDLSEGKFKKALNIKLSFKQLNNLIIVFNYIANIIFLVATLYVPFSYFILLAVNILFYCISFIYTSSERKNIKEAINNKEAFLIDLLKFKQKFTISVLSSLYLLIILLPLIFLIEFYDLTTLLFFSYLIVILIAFYFKIRMYIFFYFNKIFSNLINVELSFHHSTYCISQFLPLGHTQANELCLN